MNKEFDILELKQTLLLSVRLESSFCAYFIDKVGSVYLISVSLVKLGCLVPFLGRKDRIPASLFYR